MFDFEKFNRTENWSEQVSLLGAGLSAFFKAYPEPEAITPQQAASHAPFTVDFHALAEAATYVGALHDNSRGIKLEVNGATTTLGAVRDKLEPYKERVDQGLALEIFNNLANSPTPDDDYKILQHLVGRAASQKGAAVFSLPGFTPGELAEKSAEQMALAHLNLAQHTAMRIDENPLANAHKAAQHLTAFAKWNKSAARTLEAQDIRAYMGPKFQRACVATARTQMLELMTQPPTRLLDKDGYVDSVARSIDDHLGAANTTVADVFTEGAVIGGKQLTQSECVTRYHAALHGLRATQQVYLRATHG